MTTGPAKLSSGINLVFWAGSATIGGVDSWVSELKKRFSRSDYATVVLSDSKTFAGNEKTDIIISSWEQAEEMLERLSPAIVIPNWRYPLFGICAKLNKKGLNIKALGFCHSDSEKEYYEPLAWYESAISKFIAIGPLCADKLIEHIPHRREDIFHLPYGINIPDIKRKTYSLRPLKILYFGRLCQDQKRVYDLATLAKLLEGKKISYTLDIIGSGPDESSLSEKLSALKLGTKVRVLRQVSHAEILIKIRDYDIFVQTSEYEGLGLSMVESMSAKLIPVVTKASGGAWTVIEYGKSGFCVDIGDIESMAGILESISCMGQEEAGRIGQEAYATAKRNFDIDNIYPMFLDIMKLCMESGGREWVHGDTYIMPNGRSSRYFPSNRFLGLFLRWIFAIFPRKDIRNLLRVLGIHKDEK